MKKPRPQPVAPVAKKSTAGDAAEKLRGLLKDLEPRVAWFKFTSELNEGRCWCSESFGWYARLLPIQWPAERMKESVSHYLRAPWESLAVRYHLGSYECDLLLWNVKVIADYHRSRRAGVSRGEVTEDGAAVQAAFDACGIPLDYPISATFFSQQLKTIMASRQSTTLLDVTVWIWRARWSDLLRERQLGKIALMAIQAWLAALCAREPVAMQAVLPIRATGVGLDLGTMARLAADQNPKLSVPILHRRFVGGETLQCIGKSVRLTRSRVGHAELEFRHYLAAFLGAMPRLRQSLWEEWTTTGIIQPVESAEPRQIRELAAAAVGRIFEASPQGRIPSSVPAASDRR